MVIITFLLARTHHTLREVRIYARQLHKATVSSGARCRGPCPQLQHTSQAAMVKTASPNRGDTPVASSLMLAWPPTEGIIPTHALELQDSRRPNAAADFGPSSFGPSLESPKISSGTAIV